MSDTSRPEHSQQPDSPYGQQSPYGQSSPYGQQSPYGQSSPYGQQQNFRPYFETPSYTTSPYVNPVPQPKGMSIAGLVLGIVSIFGGVFFLIPPILGAVFSHIGLSREPAGRGMAIAGLVLNYVCLLGFLALALLMIVIGTSFDGLSENGVVPTYPPTPLPTVSGPVT